MERPSFSDETRARGWCYTFNNYTEEDVTRLSLMSQPIYHVFGKEIGESGTPHLQGFLYMKNPRKFKCMKKLIGNAHIAPLYGNSTPLKAAMYCKKSDPNPFEFGICPIGPIAKGQTLEERRALNVQFCSRLIDEGAASIAMIGDIKPNQLPLLKKAEEILKRDLMPCPPLHPFMRNYFLYGPKGTGKTYMAERMAYDLYCILTGDQRKQDDIPYEDMIYVMCPDKDWMDGYNGQPTMIIDEIDESTRPSVQFMKRITLKRPVRVQVKGGSMMANPAMVIGISNYNLESVYKRPADLAALERRFKLVHMYEANPALRIDVQQDTETVDGRWRAAISEEKDVIEELAESIEVMDVDASIQEEERDAIEDVHFNIPEFQMGIRD